MLKLGMWLRIGLVGLLLLAFYLLYEHYVGVVADRDEYKKKTKEQANKIVVLAGELESSEADKVQLLSDLRWQESLLAEHFKKVVAAKAVQVEVAAELSEVIENDETARNWADTPLPDNVKCVLGTAFGTPSDYCK
ncbi:hypothetical protein [Pseudoalteromonas sp.]|uniref:hypothetical protein n=1 Tax=Pseudoalteromonas sp. TaxID=53249 RepID=UPI00235502BD|nr:hypothetical protein [Pseudoalteromonas sp.]